MDPLTIALAGSVLGPVFGGILGNVFGAGDRDAAYKASMDAYNEIKNLGVPPDLAAPIILKHMQSAGVLTPELEKQINIGVSQAAQVQEDPKLREAQMDALNQLSERSKTGLTATDRARLNDVLTQTNRTNEANQNSIIQNMQARGQGGAGAELAARLSAAQNAGNQANSNSLDVASQANQAALQALGQYGNLSGSIRSQDFSNNMAKANASDEFNRFNTQNQINTQQRNVDRGNSANQYNLQNQQNIANQNVGMDNQELQRQRQAQLTQYQLEQQNAKMRSDADIAKANVLSGKAAQTGQQWSNIGGAIGAGSAAVGQYYNNQDQNTLNKRKQNLAESQFEEMYGYNPNK